MISAWTAPIIRMTGLVVSSRISHPRPSRNSRSARHRKTPTPAAPPPPPSSSPRRAARISGTAPRVSTAEQQVSTRASRLTIPRPIPNNLSRGKIISPRSAVPSSRTNSGFSLRSNTSTGQTLVFLFVRIRQRKRQYRLQPRKPDRVQRARATRFRWPAQRPARCCRRQLDCSSEQCPGPVSRLSRQRPSGLGAIR